MLAKRISTYSLGIFVWLLPLTVIAVQEKDHPLIGRYEGSELALHTHTDFDETDLIDGPFAGNSNGEDKRGWKHLEGEVDFYCYELPAGRSSLEALRNYESSLKANGFDIPFTCGSNNGSCFAKRPGYADQSSPGLLGLAFDHPELPQCKGGHVSIYFQLNARYLLAVLPRPEGTVYASIAFAEGSLGNFAFVRVVTTKEMEKDKIKFVGAGQMQDALSDKGRISLYGIQFDFDKDVIKPESKPTLDEIAKLLRANTELRLAIVGHTDKQGTADYNVDLSKRRAENVVAALTDEYAIAASRLSPHGAGASEPLASNDTDEGRAKNRRVELVKQ